MQPKIRLSLALLFLALAGCASLPPGTTRSPRDPWERVNRASYKFNDAIDRGLVKPVSRGYVKVFPQFMRTGVTNFFDNLEYPITIVNDLLQGQIKGFFNDTGRLVLNTTLGIGGFLDPATAAGLDKNQRDLGQTLGKWGVKSGPYVVLPIFGPSDVRDAVGRLGDDYANPRHYLNDTWVQVGLWVARGVDIRSRLLPLDPTVQSAYDPYAFVRNAYLQNRDFKVRGEDAQSHEDEQEQKLLDEAAAQESETTETPPAAPPEKKSPPPPESTPQGAPQEPPR